MNWKEKGKGFWMLKSVSARVAIRARLILWKENEMKTFRIYVLKRNYGVKDVFV